MADHIMCAYFYVDYMYKMYSVINIKCYPYTERWVGGLYVCMYKYVITRQIYFI